MSRKIRGRVSRKNLRVRVRDGVLTIEIGAGALLDYASEPITGVDTIHFARDVANRLVDHGLLDTLGDAVDAALGER